jgi:hypothetical protein
MATQPNPAAIPVVTCEYPFYLPSSEWPRPPARRKAQGPLPGYCTLSTAGHRLKPKNLDMIRFPPAVNGWGTTHHIPDMVPPLKAKGEGPPT